MCHVSSISSLTFASLDASQEYAGENVDKASPRDSMNNILSNNVDGQLFVGAAFPPSYSDRTYYTFGAFYFIT